MSLRDILHSDDATHSSVPVASNNHDATERLRELENGEVSTRVANPAPSSSTGLVMERKEVASGAELQTISQSHKRLSTAMCKKVAETLTLTGREIECIGKFIQAAKELETMLGSRADVHCLLSIHDDSIVPGRQ